METAICEHGRRKESMQSAEAAECLSMEGEKSMLTRSAGGSSICEHIAGEVNTGDVEAAVYVTCLGRRGILQGVQEQQYM
jgi:hypothetical protein